MTRGNAAAASINGEGGNRTRDTTIFSRVLYQLSYLAAVGRLVEAAETRFDRSRRR